MKKRWKVRLLAHSGRRLNGPGWKKVQEVGNHLQVACSERPHSFLLAPFFAAIVFLSFFIYTSRANRLFRHTALSLTVFWIRWRYFSAPGARVCRGNRNTVNANRRREPRIARAPRHFRATRRETNASSQCLPTARPTTCNRNKTLESNSFESNLNRFV